MDTNILSAIKRIDPASLSYQEWMNVGFALQHEGYDWTVWDDWSKADVRYKRGECERKWRGMRGSTSPVTGATIIHMAQERGWTPYGEDGCLAWDDVIWDDSDYSKPREESKPWNPTEELKTYLKTLFRPDERVGYVTNDVWQDEDGSWAPGRGVFDRTAGELIESLERHPEDLGATVGDWKPECGAWIRFNPVDGHGVRNENVTAYRFALVESDTMTIPDQEALYRLHELPIACLVNSGGKSIHAIVRVDAANSKEYRKRVEFLYSYLEQRGMKIDKQNRNESRLSRMPGITRNGKRQSLEATNIGCHSWAEWMDFVEGEENPLPTFENLADCVNEHPQLPEELIEGILRCGHKMLISGSSKAGKSFLLMELCAAITEGGEWLGFRCRKGKVLYVNLEIDRASCIHRFEEIYNARGTDSACMKQLTLWNLRGSAVPLDKLAPKLIRRVAENDYAAIIIDPIYKVITGDENNASDMGAFCNQFDKICKATGAAVIYCHHHSKGAQGDKKATDRASGSGVFARDPDAQLDMIELALETNMSEEAKARGRTAWRLESSLREFPNIVPVEFWFEYPLHYLAHESALGDAPACGSFAAARMNNKKYTTREQRTESIQMAFTACSIDPNEPVTVTALADYLGITERCVRDRLKEMKDVFDNKRGIVTRRLEDEN